MPVKMRLTLKTMLKTSIKTQRAATLTTRSRRQPYGFLSICALFMSANALAQDDIEHSGLVAEKSTSLPTAQTDTTQANEKVAIEAHGYTTKPVTDSSNEPEPTEPIPETETETEPETETLSKQRPDNNCKFQTNSNELVDRVRASTHTRLCNTAGWIDGLFGDQERYNGEQFRGKISIGFKEDEIEGLDPRLRVRIKTKLPNLSKRFNAFLGRVEEDSYVANTEVNEDRLNNVGLRSTNDEDSEWLVGLGYRGPSADYNGWDYSVGAKISGGFRPYAKAAHRYVYELSENSYFNTTQTVFWRKEERFGVSSNADYTRFIGDNDIWVSHASVKYTEEEEQLEWFADTRWHHSFSKKRGISSSAYVRGEAENEIPIPEFGLTFTYIRPVLRDWIYMETGLDLRWERQTRAQPTYKSAIKFGIQFEMLMGDYYRRGRHK